MSEVGDHTNKARSAISSGLRWSIGSKSGHTAW